jgi:hypothetical protein
MFRFAGALVELEECDMDLAMERIIIDLATGGYLVFDQGTAEHYFVTHDEIRRPGFSAQGVLCRPPPDETPDMQSLEHIRCRRRIMARPHCASVSVKGKQSKKHRRQEHDERTEDHMSRTSMREKDADRILPKANYS